MRIVSQQSRWVNLSSQRLSVCLPSNGDLFFGQRPDLGFLEALVVGVSQAVLVLQVVLKCFLLTKVCQNVLDLRDVLVLDAEDGVRRLGQHQHLALLGGNGAVALVVLELRDGNFHDDFLYKY